MLIRGAAKLQRPQCGGRQRCGGSEEYPLRTAMALRTDRADLRRRAARHRSLLALHRQGQAGQANPLTKPTAKLLRGCLSDRDAAPTDPLFPNRHGRQLSRDAVADLLSKHVTTATRQSPSLAEKHVTPHVLRHTAAMALLHAGVDISTIALWLGHATTKATEVYLHADLALKEQALARTAPPAVGRNRYHAADSLIRFLQSW